MDVITKSISAKITSEWQAFISSGRPGNLIPPDIMESWIRCKLSGVDPYDGACYHILPKAQLDELLLKRQEFIDIARPFMQNLYEFVRGSGFVVVITDERGYILELFGDAETLEKSSKYNFVQGAKWTEEEVGTNAIGTCLILRKPFQTSGSEHYCYKHHEWTCSAAPIFSRDGQMMGILDMSGPLNGTHLHTLGMVVAAAEAVVDQMQIQEKNRQLTIASRQIQEKNRQLTITNTRMINIYQTMSDGVLLIDDQGVVINVNPVAGQIIGKSDRDLIGHSIEEILNKRVPAIERTLKRKESYNDVEVIVDTPNGRVHCLSSGTPILDDDGLLTDVVILVRPIEKVQKLVNRFSRAEANFHFSDIISRSPKMANAVRIASRAAAGSSNILLEGESGTGKELFAQAIHNSSSRRKGPFVAINCGAIPRELIGSELFGYAEGAFTGAKRGGRPGKFELAGGGTLFLDEISDMPLEQQVALLRVLQDRRINRIGDDKIIPVDFRVICAANKNLLDKVAKGSFRQDLYYRINVVYINIPPLRDRCEDIPDLIEHFVKVIGRKERKIELDHGVLEYLKQYDWPGNVRELQNMVERLINTTEDGCIDLNRLKSSMHRNTDKETPGHSEPAARPVSSVRGKRRQLIAEMEYQKIIDLLAKHNGCITLVAREMGVSRNTIYRKMRLFGIDY